MTTHSKSVLLLLLFPISGRPHCYGGCQRRLATMNLLFFATAAFLLLGFTTTAFVSAQQWTTASLSVARQSLVATSVVDVALFGGGWLSSNISYDPNGVTSATVDIFNATSNIWTRTALSSPRSFQLAATSVRDVALFGGGATTDSLTGYTNVVDIFNATSGIWTTTALSQARDWFAAASVKDVALFGGGGDYYTSCS